MWYSFWMYYMLPGTLLNSTWLFFIFYLGCFNTKNTPLITALCSSSPHIASTHLDHWSQEKSREVGAPSRPLVAVTNVTIQSRFFSLFLKKIRTVISAASKGLNRKRRRPLCRLNVVNIISSWKLSESPRREISTDYTLLTYVCAEKRTEPWATRLQFPGFYPACSPCTSCSGGKQQTVGVYGDI